jgi:UDPglucose--hexose-1-phosphate uridylyltransferase
VEALQKSLRKFEKNLNDPDYNFFIHTAPIKDKEKYDHYHWHVEVSPKFTIAAGFELGTGVEINVVDPDVAAKLLRK